MQQEALVKSLLEQARWCEKLGSSFYGNLLLRIADNVQSSGICWRLLEQRRADPRRSLLPLRFLAAIHRLVLANQLPELAAFYPSMGGVPQADAAWQTLERELRRCGDLVLDSLPESVQTNEVARSCALLPGFLAAAKWANMPLRLLELGCSAGLNLRWDCYRYDTPSGAWGPSSSPVHFVNPFGESGPDLSGVVTVSERSGCDLHPIDPTTADGRRTLLSFVWPDQMDRFRLLLRASDIAGATPAKIERANAIDWLPAQLDRMPSGVATVVFHSIFMLYVSHPDQHSLVNIILDAGNRARPDAPFAWLSMEQTGQAVEIQLSLWPGGLRKRIAVSDYHGTRTVIL
ncbi:MAG TPA: DUF2332 family protein [Bryobacteraceae bacterium]|nr:DUF2332 family protein [Bryobacteraceae bacterium]